MAIWTAQYRYSGQDRVDITSKMSTILSPPWSLVTAYKKSEKEATYCGSKDKAEGIMLTAQSSYTTQYLELLNISIGTNLSVFKDFIEHGRKYNLTLVCFCNVIKTGFCHRLLAAHYIEQHFGVTYMGER